MQERLRHLKIKIQSLTDESRNIRKEARKVSGMEKWNLNHHRTTTVRDASRYNLLAYGLLRGVPYEVIEKKCNEPPSFRAVAKHATQFGGQEADIYLWVEDAKAYLKSNKEAFKLAS